MKSEICFVHLSNIMAIPYLCKYTDLVDKPFDIIYWNRGDIDETCGAGNYYALNYTIPDGASKATKLIGYLKFRLFATKVLNQNQYKKVILLTGNVAVLLRDVLLKNYFGRYIIDIRDYFLEYNRLYYRAEKQLIDSSAMAVISSEAFKTFLPEHEYVLVHNSPDMSSDEISAFRQEHQQWRKTRSENSPLVLSYIGGVRFFEQDKKVLHFFANDDRFFIRYIGVGADLLRPFCEGIGMKNVYLHDRFSPEETQGFYKETDMILNLYGNGTPLLDYALSNKLYYAAALGLPILVCSNTYMERVTLEGGFGFTVDLDDGHQKDRLYSLYKSINWPTFYNNCKIFYNTILSDNEKWSEKVYEYLH